MKSNRLKRNLVLGILFFLPVAFLLMLYPSTNNYNPLDTVKEDVLDLDNLESHQGDIVLSDHLTVLAFLGKHPELRVTPALNLKELIYDKFKGFKKFQIVVVVSEEAEEETTRLRRELTRYSELKYWHFVSLSNNDAQRLFNGLRSSQVLDYNSGTDHVFIIDKEKNQRGRLDDRVKKEIENEDKIYPLTSYNCGEVSVLKNKMSDDLRVLFTEYRQKRKGKFDSSNRRADDIKPQEISNEKK